MKKILFVNGHLNVGGVENSLINVLKRVDYNHYEIDLILFEGLGDYAHEVPKEVNVISYDLSKAYGPLKQCILDNIRTRNWFWLCFRLITLLEKIIGVKAFTFARPLFKLSKRYDCAIAYRVGICTDFVGYVINSKKKITWWHHGTFDYPEKVIKRLTKVFQKFDEIIAVSDSSNRMIRSNIDGIENKTITIPNIVNADEIKQKANEETAYQIKFNENITLLSVGRLSPEKGMINCVHACKKLIENGFNIKWYLIGDGVQYGEIEKCIKDYKLENDIFLLGSIPNPYPYIKNATIYVHPSLVESLSITVLEALTLNTPAVIARSMGPMEFIRHKENGLLVEPTPDGLVGGIISLLKDDQLYTKLKKDHSDVLKNYSPEVVMKKIYHLTEVG
ncbi:glycosyltransferase [Paenibacillus cremeus]|uniref:Glycosyltransferase n=1 Tax=Paenibacillus cremeus TaxID=2163881 RepID=A0A559K0F7_9BACL|nr:glycosyltransferase [Paenibacillus cremeus]TVY05634.1 glycosyltransferase [Paenibacillus cremeus]